MMQKNLHLAVIAGLLSIGIALADEKSKPVAPKKIVVKTNSRAVTGPMRVDEPSNNPAKKTEFKISKAQRERLRDLTFEQKLAFRLHQEKMQAMIGVITEKRRILQAAKPRERAALAMELHTFILDRESGGRSAAVPARVSSPTATVGATVPAEAVNHKSKE